MSEHWKRIRSQQVCGIIWQHQEIVTVKVMNSYKSYFNIRRYILWMELQVRHWY